MGSVGVNKLDKAGERRLTVDFSDGLTIPALAKKYNVSKSTVSRILADFQMPVRQGHHSRKRKPRRAAAKGRVLKPCGTNAAYSRHKAKGEYPCPPCLEAHAAQQKEYEERKKQWTGS